MGISKPMFMGHLIRKWVEEIVPQEEMMGLFELPSSGDQLGCVFVRHRYETRALDVSVERRGYIRMILGSTGEKGRGYVRYMLGGC